MFDPWLGTKIPHTMQHCQKFKVKIKQTKLLESIKKRNQSELKNTVIEMKNALEGINSRLRDVEKHISDLEDKIVDIAQAEYQEKKKNIKVVSGTSVTMLNIIAFPIEGSQQEKRQKWAENLFDEVMDKKI